MKVNLGVSPVAVRNDNTDGVTNKELVTNGSFASGLTKWTTLTGSGNFSVADNKLTSTAGSSFTIYQVIGLENGASYEVKFTLLDYTAGSMRPVFFGGTQVNGTLRTANGSYTETIVNNSTGNTAILMAGLSSPRLSITNVSVRKL
jgi:hypothetical protein